MLRQYYLAADCQTDVSALINKPGVLAIVSFDGACAAPTETGIVPIGISSLSGKPFEVIEYGDSVAQRGITSDCHWSSIDDIFFAATWIPAGACKGSIELAAEQAYDRLFGVITEAGFPYPFRIWNYIPNINVGDGDQEEYKQFCVGRQRAFSRLELSQQQYPAASALGTKDQHGGGIVYLLATRAPVKHYENPRQKPAYEYPRRYGPSSPSFARATSVTWSQHSIFVSGTASIIGHDTKAAGDLKEQLKITLENIRYLLQSISANAETLSSVRVYLRHKKDFVETQTYLLQEFPAEVFNIVHADICRDNLLVEIEAVFHAATLK